MINQKGITLIEALVVMALIALIVAISVPMTLQLIRRYKCESEIRTIYASWLEARQRAMERNVPYLISISKKNVLVHEDKNRNGTADPTEKVNSLSQDLLTFDLAGTVDATAIPALPGHVVATANDKGLIQAAVVAWVVQIKKAGDPEVPIDAPFNCVITNVTRIGLGKFDGTNCVVQ